MMRPVLLIMIFMAGCATGGSGSGTDKGTGIGGTANVTIGGTHYYGIPNERFQNLAVELGVTKTALQTFFKTLGEQNVPPDEYDQKLREIAKNYKIVQDELQTYKSGDSEVVALKHQAGEALEAGEIERAETLLQKAWEKDIEVIERSQQVTDSRLRSAAATTKQLGDLKRTQLAYLVAATHYRKAIELLPKNAEKIRADYSIPLGIALYQAGDYGGAEKAFTEALVIREQIFGKEHPTIAESLNNLAGALWSQGRYDEADMLNQRALAIREKVFGKEHQLVASTLNNLASIYYSKGRYADAETLYKRALVIYEKLNGKEHPDVANTISNLASVYYSERRFLDAETLYKQALTIQEKVLGKQHLDVAATLYNLAHLYDFLGRNAEAEPLYKRALNIVEKLLWEQHPRVVQARTNYAHILRKLNRDAEAEAMETRLRAITVPPPKN